MPLPRLLGKVQCSFAPKKVSLAGVCHPAPHPPGGCWLWGNLPRGTVSDSGVLLGAAPALLLQDGVSYSPSSSLLLHGVTEVENSSSVTFALSKAERMRQHAGMRKQLPLKKKNEVPFSQPLLS